MDRFAGLRSTLLFYVPPHDAVRDAAFLFSRLGARKACLVREISKLHEDVIDFTLPDIPADAVLKGEMVLVVEGAPDPAEALLALDVKEHFARYVAGGMTEKEAMKAVARDRGVSKSAVYAELKGGRS